MNKIVIDLKNVSREEVTELQDYLEDNSWNWKKLITTETEDNADLFTEEEVDISFFPEKYTYEEAIKIMDKEFADKHKNNFKTKATYYYQPKLNPKEWLDTDLPSFGVYYHYTNARADFPDNTILEYEGTDIENPTYMDKK